MKKNIKLSFIVLTGILVSACASTQVDFNRHMQVHVGQPTHVLIKKLGKPEKQFQQQGKVILVYRPFTLNMPIPVNIQYVTGGMRLETANQNVYADCSVYFSIKNDIVQSWSTEGSECPD